MTTTTLITVAPTGAESDKAEVPALPVTLDELVADRQGVRGGRRQRRPRAHPRRRRPPDPRPGPAARRPWPALRESTDLIVQLSSGGAVTDPEADRLAVLDAGPEMASCTMGTVNFGDDVFLNRWEFIVDLHTRMQERGIVPEYEIFDLGQLTSLERLLDKYGLPAGGHVHVDFVMGVPGGMPGTAEALVACTAGAAGPARAAPRSPPPASAAPRCRCCSPRCRPAATCGSAWRTPSPTPRASRWRATPSWSPGRPRSPGWPSARR